MFFSSFLSNAKKSLFSISSRSDFTFNLEWNFVLKLKWFRTHTQSFSSPNYFYISTFFNSRLRRKGQLSWHNIQMRIEILEMDFLTTNFILFSKENSELNKSPKIYNLNNRIFYSKIILEYYFMRKICEFHSMWYFVIMLV